MTPRLPGPAPGSRQSEKTTMIRAIAWATMLGALVASVAVYSISKPGWRNGIFPKIRSKRVAPSRRVSPAQWLTGPYSTLSFASATYPGSPSSNPREAI